MTDRFARLRAHADVIGQGAVGQPCVAGLISLFERSLLIPQGRYTRTPSPCKSPVLNNWSRWLRVLTTRGGIGLRDTDLGAHVLNKATQAGSWSRGGRLPMERHMLELQTSRAQDAKYVCGRGQHKLGA